MEDITRYCFLSTFNAKSILKKIILGQAGLVARRIHTYCPGQNFGFISGQNTGKKK